MKKDAVLILTGQSGSGKSTAVRALEDRGFLCIDNVPVALLDRMVAMANETEHGVGLAMVVDVREPDLLSRAPEVIGALRQQGVPVRLIFFEANEDALLRRYSETRRRHPLDHGEGLRAALAREERILAPLRELADETIDSSRLSPHALRARVVAQLVGAELGDDLRVALTSFGFKAGLPLEADMVLDVRFLPNPYFVPELREHSGLEEAVSRYVLAAPEAQTFVTRVVDLLRTLVPLFQKEGKRYLTVAVGCTGGKHRSVAIVEAIGAHLAEVGVRLDVVHRDVAKGGA